MNSILYFTKYSEEGPSSRYRSFQYKFYLEKEFSLRFYPLFKDNYIERLYQNRRTDYIKLFKAYFIRIVQVLKCLGTDQVVFIEYELLPYFPPILEYLLYKTKVKIVLDYDDAIFHNYDLHQNFIIRGLLKNKIPYIAKKAKVVISGSPYLTTYFLNHNENVVEIPTSLIFERCVNIPPKISITDFLSIGWIGSKSTSINVIFIREVIESISFLMPGVIFKFMGFDSHLKSKLNFPNVKFYDWSVREEDFFLNDIDLGIMPLRDTPSNRGKCGFKLIQYMSFGKPTLSTPLEANVKINRDNSNLFATTHEEWVKSIIHFGSNLNYFRKVGLKNKEIVKRYYSVEGNSIHYINIFNQVFNVRN